MESALSLSEAEEKRGREGGGLSLGFGSSGLQPQKLMRTGPALSFRAATSYYYDEPVRALQAFPSDSRSAGIGMGMGLGGGVLVRGFPFTPAQWQELQRQALIYKHFVASVPVPPDLLLPSAARCFPEAPLHLLATNHGMVVGGGACYRFTGTADNEPGRCRRTDGKKWRCSRDVAPGMKYCERHVHRGRPRSRKPVEAHNKNKSTSTSSTIATPSAPANTTTTAPVLKLPFQSMEPPKEARCMDVNQEWELMHLKMGLRSEPVAVLPQYEDQFNVSYTDLNEQCYSFLNPDFPSLEEAAITEQRDPPRSFIDAWSNENPITNANKYKSPSISAAGHLPVSTLTLSMSGVEEDSDQIRMGLGLSDALAKSQASGWTGSVTAFGGGPLAEVLQSSNVTSPHNGCSSSSSSKSSCGGLMNLMGKGGCGSHEVSPQESPKRLASSPTGVLQKALVSLSDGSSNSSPTFAAAASRSEIALQWLNQSK